MARAAFALLLAPTLLLLAACGDSDPTPALDDAPKQASAVHGGKLYDKFWKVSDATAPASTHPLWSKRPDADSNKRTGSDTWRCKECHGWDYRGAAGAYAQGSHKTGIAGVFGSDLSAEALGTSLAEAHGYKAAGLAAIDLESLVMFLREGLVDTTKWIDDEGSFRGDAAKGKALYMKGLGSNRACKVCHGEDGLKPPKGAPADYNDFVGMVASKNPTEFLHKVRFGHPGSKMPAAVKGAAAMQDISDLAAFTQTLPKAK
jgi:mono/diheme cytochrome c family protein